MSWPESCGSELANPFCLNAAPTDPYSWFFLDDKWSYAPQWTTSAMYADGDAVTFEGRIYVCASGPGCSGAPSGDPSWAALTSIQPATGPLQLECSTTGPPQPDPQSGSCLKSSLSGPAAACVNPCVRLPNGNLVVNKQTSQCRVFAGTNEGGSAVTVSGATACSTVCPQTCVELWETCPPGTAPLTTLVQTKTPEDLMALTGPFRADGSLNPLWPANYATSNKGLAAIGGKPYTECYSFNTEFCELPMARQITTSGAAPGPLGTGPLTSCYAACPAGTFQDPADPFTCLFVPLSGTYDPTNPGAYGPTTAVQKVYCNPQYFNPAYWDAGYGGVQKGCTAIPLPTKQGSTCSAGTLPIINENFNLEWCLPACANGFVADLAQSTCLATCAGTTDSYNVFHDYVDFYATTDRCAKASYTAGSQTFDLELECAQNFHEGRCPALQKRPVGSSIFGFTLSMAPYDVLAKRSSINTQCAAKRFREWATTGLGLNLQDYNAYLTYLDSVQRYQAAHPRGPGKLSSNVAAETDQYGECPAGMVFGDRDCDETPGICYDECMEGYEPVTFCANGAKTCALKDTVYACRAQCPAQDEGLGPWQAVNDGGVFTCRYQYPSGSPPTDPSLWVQCPDDGRYSTLTTTSTDVALTQAAANRTPPQCVRNMYLRQSTCPIGFNGNTDAATGLTRCSKACDADEVVLTLSDGTVACQAALKDTARHDFDFTAAADAQVTKPEFRHRVLRRKNYVRGRGSDPNQGLGDPDPTPEPQWLSIVKYAAIGIGVLLLVMLFRSSTSG